MLNAIQHGLTIADLRICRKRGQCGFRNIGDWGEGLNHVGKKMALIEALVALVAKESGTKKGSTKIEVPVQKNILAGMNGQDPLLYVLVVSVHTNYFKNITHFNHRISINNPYTSLYVF
jgi:hypothetical protein